MQKISLELMLDVLNEEGLNYLSVKELTDETRLDEDLCLDSLDVVEFTMGLEVVLDIGDIDSDICFKTIGEIRKYIEENYE